MTDTSGLCTSDIVTVIGSVSPDFNLRAYVFVRKDGPEGYGVSLYDCDAELWLPTMRLFPRDVQAAVDYARSLVRS